MTVGAESERYTTTSLHWKVLCLCALCARSMCASQKVIKAPDGRMEMEEIHSSALVVSSTMTKQRQRDEWNTG